MGVLLLGWLAATAVVAVLCIAAFAVAMADDGALLPMAPIVSSGRRVTTRLVFVTALEHDVVIDGLLAVDDPTLGVPMTWKLEIPPSGVLREAVVHRLEAWADDGASLEVDLSKLGAPHPSVALREGDVSLVRLPVAGPPLR